MGSSFLYQENPAGSGKAPLYEEGGTIANGDQGGEENFPVSFADSPLLIEGAFVRCAWRSGRPGAGDRP